MPSPTLNEIDDSEEREVGEKTSFDEIKQENEYDEPAKKKQKVITSQTNNDSEAGTKKLDNENPTKHQQNKDAQTTKQKEVNSATKNDPDKDEKEGEISTSTASSKTSEASSGIVPAANTTNMTAATLATKALSFLKATPEQKSAPPAPPIDLPLTKKTVPKKASSTKAKKPAITKKTTTTKSKKKNDDTTSTKTSTKSAGATKQTRGINPPWGQRYQELLEYKKEFGHTNVPQNYAANPSLGHWVRNQRSRYKKYMEAIMKEREKEASAAAAATTRESQKVQEDKVGGTSEKNNDGVSNSHESESEQKKTSSTLSKPDPQEVRGEYSKLMDELTPTMTRHIEKLEEIGFEWLAKNRVRYATWDQRFGELQAYHKEHGHVNLPLPPDDASCMQLKLWCQTQRTAYMHLQQGKPSQMNNDRIQKLDTLDFDWHGQRKTTSFQVRLKELKEFKAKFGDVSVPKKFRANPGLGIWCHEKRRLYKSRSEGHKTSLTDKQVEALDRLGFVWSFKGQPYSAWDRYFRDLIQYKAEHGNCFVPKDYDRNKRLGNWVDKQHKNFQLIKEGRPSPMTQEQRDKLDKLQFFKVSWRAYMEDLKKYKDVNGNCNVPQAYKTLRTNLGQWVMRQRAQYRLFATDEKSQLDAEKVKELEELGFEWGRGNNNRQRNTRNKKWEEHLEELREYKEKFGNVDVVSGVVPKEYTRLSGWVNHQRTEYLKFTQNRPSYLTKERIDALSELGFNWTLKYRKIPWEERIIELIKYKEQHGHLHVPKRMGNLGTWCHERRKQYKLYEAGKKCSMTKEQIQELKDLEFVFHPTQSNFGRKKTATPQPPEEDATETKKSSSEQSKEEPGATANASSWPDHTTAGGGSEPIAISEFNVTPTPPIQAQTLVRQTNFDPSGMQLQQQQQPQFSLTHQQTQASSLPPQFYPPPSMPQAQQHPFQQQMNMPIQHQNTALDPQQFNFQAQQSHQQQQHQQQQQLLQTNMQFPLMPGGSFQQQ